VAHAIATTADEVRKELLALARKIPGSPLTNAQADDVRLTDGMIVSKMDAGRAVSIADAMRHGALDRRA
jgi:xanthine dehydrogenase YagR molybdenum-binding subunit